MTTLLGTIGILSLVGTITFLLLLLMQIVLKNYLHASWFYGSILFLSLFWILPLWKFVPQVSAYTFFAIDTMQSIIVPDTGTTAPAKNTRIWFGLEGSIAWLRAFWLCVLSASAKSSRICCCKTVGSLPTVQM